MSPSRNIQTFLSPSRDIQTFMSPSRDIQTFMSPSRDIQTFMSPSRDKLIMPGSLELNLYLFTMFFIVVFLGLKVFNSEKSCVFSLNRNALLRALCRETQLKEKNSFSNDKQRRYINHT